MITIKQTRPIRPPQGLDAGQRREPNERYVYLLTAFVSLGALLFGYDQGVMGKQTIQCLHGRAVSDHAQESLLQMTDGST